MVGHLRGVLFCIAYLSIASGGVSGDLLGVRLFGGENGGVVIGSDSYRQFSQSCFFHEISFFKITTSQILTFPISRGEINR